MTDREIRKRRQAGKSRTQTRKQGTNNVYIEDGYGDAKTGNGGSYSACADTSNPGVKPVTDYLSGD